MLQRTLAITIHVVLLVSSSAFAQAPPHLWSDRFGDSEAQEVRSAAVDVSGNVIINGSFRGTLDFGGGPLNDAGNSDIFVVKFDPDGNHVWSKRFGDVFEQLSGGAAVDGSGNVIVTGYFEGTVDPGGGPLTSAGYYDIFVAKFDPDGNHVWSKRFGDIGDQLAVNVAVDGSGNVIATGYFRSTVDFGGGVLTSAGADDIFVVKFDPDGNHLWSKRFGDSTGQGSTSVAVDASGNILATGWFMGAVDFGGGPLTGADYSDDIFVVKFDPDGSHVWSKRFGDSNEEFTSSIAVEASGNTIVTGSFWSTVDFGGGLLTSAGGYDIFVAKFDSDGDHVWSKRFGDSQSQYGNSVAVDESGDAIATGAFFGTVDFGGGALTSAGGGDVFVAQFDPDGNHLWSARFGDSDSQGSRSVAVDASTDVLVTGVFEGTVDFGGGPFTSAGSYDIFVAKFGSTGTGVVIPSPSPGLVMNSYPNPFNPTTTISFTLPWSEKAILAIYSIQGTLVTTLVDETLDAGFKEVTWNGRDSRGNPVSSGVYFYRLTAGGKALTKKMVLLK